MPNKYFILFFLLIDFVSPIVYTCDRNASCGCSKTSAIVNKIVGGESAINSSWGWSVSIRGSGNRHLCGGVIISPLYILTAAHCVTDPDLPVDKMRVVAGIDELSQSSSSIAQVRSIVHSISHHQYNTITNANDIAVLRLNQSLIISNERDTARLCLPHTNSTSAAINYPIPDSKLVAIGWGRLSSGSSSIPFNQHLQQVTVNALSADHRMCRSTISDPQVQFCAGVINGGKGK
jgi:transmembrane serine protease 3